MFCTHGTNLLAPPLGPSLILPAGGDVWKAGVPSLERVSHSEGGDYGLVSLRGDKVRRCSMLLL